jgi:hypothetical protein
VALFYLNFRNVHCTRSDEAAEGEGHAIEANSDRASGVPWAQWPEAAAMTGTTGSATSAHGLGSPMAAAGCDCGRCRPRTLLDDDPDFVPLRPGAKPWQDYRVFDLTRGTPWKSPTPLSEMSL